MATTQNTYTGNGSTTAYSFTFPYLEATDIKVSLDAVDTTAYTLSNATTITFTNAPTSGAAIRIYRKTYSDNLDATFYPGSAIRSSDLNNNFTQNLYVTQESDRDVSISNTTANTAKATADTALTNSTNAVNTANAATATANTADTNASAAVVTANAASATATTASTDSASAVITANTADTNASAAVVTANAASATATTASTDSASAVITANTADTNASAAVVTANNADANATTALNNSRVSNGSGGFNSAISLAITATTTANTADTNANSATATANTADNNATIALNTANAATAAVSNAVLFTLIPNVAAIPGSPSDNDYIEIGDSTGIESFTPLSGLPSYFVGAPTLTVRIRYEAVSTSWAYMSYFANNSELRYLTRNIPVVTGDSTNGSGQITFNCENNSHGVKIKGPPHSAAASYTLTLPNDTGTVGQFLQTNGSGSLSFATVDTAYIETPQVITMNKTIGANSNAALMGDVAISSGTTISIGQNSILKVLT
jgi:hypothetical protein